MDQIPNMNSTIWSQLFEYQIIRIIRCNSEVYTSPTSTYDTFLESLGQDLSNPAYIGLISDVINRVNLN